MKNLLIILIVLIIAQTGFGQSLFFNDEIVDSIIISSYNGAFQFDEKGTTKGKEETLAITYSKTKNCFLISNHQLKTSLNTFKPPKEVHKTKKINKDVGSTIEKSLLSSLLESLSASSNPKDIADNLSQDIFYHYVNKKTIKSLAKKYKLGWHFSMRYTTKENNEAFFKECKSIDTLKIYLKERFDTLGYPIITDYFNGMFVKVITKTKNEYIFEGKYPNPIYQPWYMDNGRLKIILNLNINKDLNDILPKGFLNKNTFSLKTFFDDYLQWKFIRNGIE